MAARRFLLAALMFLLGWGVSGCRRNIVSAAPPSVAVPPPPAPASQPQPPPEVVTPPAEAKETPPVEPLPPPPEVAPPAPVPPAPRPKPPEPPEAAAKPEAPQVAPQLSPAQLANARRRTTDGIRVAERNLQVVGGKPLNASQKDLFEKVREFLAQAHEAVRVEDWVRAQSLAEKAQVLSAELIKSL